MILKRFVYFFCLIPVFTFLSQLQTLIGFNSIFKYAIPVAFLAVSTFIFFKRKPLWFTSKFDSIVYICFSAFTFYLILTSVRFEMFYVQEFLVAELYVLPYLLPIFMLNINLDFNSINQYLSIGKRLLIPGIIVLVLIVFNLNQEIWLLHVYFYDIFLFGFPIMFLLMNQFHGKRIKILLYLVFTFMLFIASFYGRRSLFAEILFLFAFLQLIQISSKTFSKISLSIRYFLLSVIFVPIILTYYPDFSQLSVFQRGLSQEGWEESRGKVVEEFFEDFNTKSDWVWGRGLNGTIKRSIGSSKDSGEGKGIENGYLHLILKGGNVYFLFVLYFFLKAFYLGWFKSKNDFTKAFASLLIIHLIGMIGFNIPVFSHRYMLLWLSIPICFSVYYRELTNQQIRQLIIQT